jgi:hypothetical protein
MKNFIIFIYFHFNKEGAKSILCHFCPDTGRQGQKYLEARAKILGGWDKNTGRPGQKYWEARTKILGGQDKNYGKLTLLLLYCHLMRLLLIISTLIFTLNVSFLLYL